MTAEGDVAHEESALGYAPTTWTVDRVRDRVGAVVGGDWGGDPDGDDEGDNVVVVRVADIRGLDVASSDLTVRRVKGTKTAGRLLNERSLLIEKSGGGEDSPVGRAVLARRIDQPAICSNFMAKVDCLSSAYPLFVAYLMNAMYSTRLMIPHIQQTTGIQNLRVTDYLNTKVGFPDLAEQRRIAAYLDASCAAIDRARELKNRQMVALDLTLRAQMTALVTRGTDPDRALAPSKAPWLGPLPATWRSASLKRLLAEPMEYGLNEAAEFEDRDCPRYIRITDFGQDGRLRDDTYRSLPADVAASALLSEEDILFARSGATVGKTFIFRNHPHPACFAGYLIRARPLRRVLRPMFLYYYTKSLAYEAWKDQVFSQATIQNISAVKYGYLLVPLPPVHEQDAIIEAVEARVAEITAVRRNVEQQVEVLTAYRKSLIHECVTGIRRLTQEDLNRVLHHAVLPS